MAQPSLHLATLIIILTTLLMASMPQTLAKNTLKSGETLNEGEKLENGKYVFVMQPDCNVVLYNSDRATWATATNGQSSRCRCTLENNGNLIVYSRTNRVLWKSNTDIGSNNYELVLQSDGNAVIYKIGGGAIWATGIHAAVTPGVAVEAFVLNNDTTIATN